MPILLCMQLPSTPPRSHQFAYLYNDWSLFPNKNTKFWYYDVYEKRWKYTDGTSEVGLADMPPPDLGLPGGFPSIARSILQQANRLEWVEEDD
jgi:hypothetical protein